MAERVPEHFIRRHRERIAALRHDGTADSVAAIERAWPRRFIEWSRPGGVIHLADRDAGDNPPLLGPGDWVVDVDGDLTFCDDSEFHQRFAPATTEVPSALLDALVDAVSTRSSESDPLVVRAAQDLAVASVRRS